MFLYPVSETMTGRALALALTAALCAVALTLVAPPPAMADSSGHIGFSTNPKIKKLIYPTFGNPAIITAAPQSRSNP